jgi:hypothetical protein
MNREGCGESGEERVESRNEGRGGVVGSGKSVVFPGVLQNSLQTCGLFRKVAATFGKIL